MCVDAPTPWWDNRSMASLKSFSPEHLVQEAEQSGFFQCKTCGLIWFGRNDTAQCPEGKHGKPVHVVVLCRTCDEVIPVSEFAAHLARQEHANLIEVA
jgi:hypothetical protein